jgi:hypothetical protein
MNTTPKGIDTKNEDIYSVTSLESAARTTRISDPIEEARAAMPSCGDDPPG